MTHHAQKSDSPVVPTKQPNNAGTPAAEAVEGRGLTKVNTSTLPAVRTQSREAAPCRLARVRRRARQDKNVRFTALLHHITVDRLREAFHRLNKHAAVGVDEVGWATYQEELEANLQRLHTAIHRHP